MAGRDSSSRSDLPSGRGPVPTLEGIFPRSHPSTETLLKLGAAALLLGPFAGVPAILLGRLTVGEIESSRGRYSGEARARLGLNLGWAGTLLHALLGLYFLGASSEAIALVVLGLGAVVALVLAVGALIPAAPRPFLAAGALARRAPRLVVPAVLGLIAAGAAGFVSKRSADERARLEALAACNEERRAAAEALGAGRLDRAAVRLAEARRLCAGAELDAVEREAAEVAAKEREEIQRREEEAAALAARRRAEEEARRAERERQAAARFPEIERVVASRLQLVSAKSAQRRWDEAEVALQAAATALEELRDTEVARSERWASLSAQVERLRPTIHAGVEQLREQREEQERRREERARRLEEAREAAREAAAEARRGSAYVKCNDGTYSPTCLCSRASFRGCCSHHGGVDGCD